MLPWQIGHVTDGQSLLMYHKKTVMENEHKQILICCVWAHRGWWWTGTWCCMVLNEPAVNGMEQGDCRYRLEEPNPFLSRQKVGGTG